MEACVKTIRKAKFVEQHGRCYYCRQPMWEKNGDQFAVAYGLTASAAHLLRSTAEHLVAQQDGGADTKQNIVAACRFCNWTRHKTSNPKAPIDYRRKVRDRLRKGKWHGFVLTPVTG